MTENLVWEARSRATGIRSTESLINSDWNASASSFWAESAVYCTLHLSPPPSPLKWMVVVLFHRFIRHWVSHTKGSWLVAKWLACSLWLAACLESVDSTLLATPHDPLFRLFLRNLPLCLPAALAWHFQFPLTSWTTSATLCFWRLGLKQRCHSCGSPAKTHSLCLGWPSALIFGLCCLLLILWSSCWDLRHISLGTDFILAFTFK